MPGAATPEELWTHVAAGDDLVSQVPADRWGIATDDVMCAGPEDRTDRTWSDRGGYVRGFDDLFDADGFGLPAEEILALDPVFKWTFHTAREALRDAGYRDAGRGTNAFQGLGAHRIGAIFGNLSFPSASMAAFTQATTIAGLAGYGVDALAEAGVALPTARNRFTSGLPALLLEQALGFGGGAMALDAACASSLYAIKLACDRLHDGTADLMLAGAVNSADDLCIHLGFSALNALSRTGRSRPFNAQADGLVPAEGCGFVALKRLSDAQTNGDTIHGVLRGVGLSNDGRGRGMLVPSATGQARAMSNALEMSGLGPGDVSLIECHATGTQVGDGVEIESTAAVYGSTGHDVPIGSLKSNMGHLITAAGVAGLIKVIEAMRHETRPSTLHIDEPLQSIEASPFRLLDAAEPWDRATTSDGVLRAGVSAFGFGGNNAHLIVEEPGAFLATALAEHSTPLAAAATPVAIVGVGVAAAQATNRGEFLDALLADSPLLDDCGQGRLGPVTLAIKSQKFPPNDLKKALGQQLALLQVADEALGQVATLPVATTGVYVGMGTDPEAARFGTRWRLASMGAAWNQSSEWITEARDAVGPPLDAAGVIGTMPNIVANRLNSQYDLTGPGFTVSAEERSGIDALKLAARALRHGEIDAALVGAADLSCDPVHQAAAKEQLGADRQTPGDAAVVLVLKRLDDAQRDGDAVYSVLGDLDSVFAAPAPADAGAPSMCLGLAAQATPITHLFGHAHAASGLVHVAAGALLLHQRATLGGMPLLASNSAQRSVDIVVEPMNSATSGSVRLLEVPSDLPSARTAAPKLHIYSAGNVAQVVEDMASGVESQTGPVRVVIVADSHAQLVERLAKAKAHIDHGTPPGFGVHVRLRPIDGEVAAVFTAAGAAYHGMGCELLRALPELVTPAGANFPLGEVANWAYGPTTYEPSPSDYLWGTSMLTQAHARLTQDILGIESTAAIGYSSGESNSLYAFGVWTDRDAMRAEIVATKMMSHELGGDFAAVARAWGEESASWAVWNVLAPTSEVLDLVAGESRAHVSILNTATDCVLAGDSEACDRIVDQVGRHRCVKVGYNLACHTPEVGVAFHQQWVDVHTRKVEPNPGVRFYSNGKAGAYDVSTENCAAAITAQAENMIDFPATIRTAYADGVRVFVEHGPAGACTNFIKEILSGHDIIAVHLDRKGKNVEQVFDVAAALTAAGVSVDHQALSDRLALAVTDRVVELGPTITFSAHAPAVDLPPRIAVVSETDVANMASPIEFPASAAVHQVMTPAPRLRPIRSGAAQPQLASAPVAEYPPRESPSLLEVPPRLATAAPGSVAGVIEQQMAAIAEIHNRFMVGQAAVQQKFLDTTVATLADIPANGQLDTTELVGRAGAQTEGVVAPMAISPAVISPAVISPVEVASTTVADRYAETALAESAPAKGASPPRGVPVKALTSQSPVGPAWTRDQLKIHSSGKISELFGQHFRAQDEFALQCRMPEPPLLLADRVTGLDAEVGVLGQGTIWTETDVAPEAWYLNEGYMPAGFMIESGQADLMLISYMGIDLLNLGERSYRLLGCTLTYHGDLPSAGETLEYEIRITGHAKHGDIRLFFFEYDCIVAGVPRLTVRDAQAGFFSSAELDDALGVLWTPQEALNTLDPAARVDEPHVACTKSAFDNAAVMAFSEGRVLDCFGVGYEWTETHTRTPKIQSGPQLFIDEITSFDPTGGPWGRGFMRCETAIGDDDWFFDGHFKNDPCMPGNFMVEACIEAMSFYLAALGYTTKRDGWRFQPLPEQPFDLKCRGEINPQADRVAYELYVEEVWDGPNPTIICDVLGYVDGRAAFHAHRIGVELTPDWPLTSRPEIYNQIKEPVAVATDTEGFPFDWKAMISCAWGRPSEAFGSMYQMFDGTRRSPRLPGAPYHFISRITKIDGELDVCEAGMKIECEYDIPADAWYFDENGAETMPYAVLLEAALQPCGWVASAIGSATASDLDLLFRNLDGTATMHEELTRTAGTLTTKVELTSVSRAGGMIIEGFSVECFLGERLVYTMSTVFGFFPPEAFEDQVGLPIGETNRARLEQAGGLTIDLTARPELFCTGSVALAEPMLLMLDRATHCKGAGEAGLGIVRGEKDVDVSEWFFKAHFFQDPVQPGSLGIEALLQLLQFYMIDTDMAEGLTGAHFEPIRTECPMSWKYRGQVTPKNTLITSTMEITEVGRDEHGPFVVGTGSLWCDGLRIYEVVDMGMRLVSGDPTGPTSNESYEVPLAEVKSRMAEYWSQARKTPVAWLGHDISEGLTERYLNSVRLPSEQAFQALQGRSVVYLANHQVQVESLIVSNLLPALTGVPMTTVAHMKHRDRWIGQAIAAIEAYPGCDVVEQIAYFDQAQPETMFEIVNDVRTKMKQGNHSFFIHADGTRSTSCLDTTSKVSSVFLDLALEMGIPVVPVRFTGGLPITPINGKAEVPHGQGAQDYWIGEPLEAEFLTGLALKERIAAVLGAINTLGGTNANERPNPVDERFASTVTDFEAATGVNEVFAAMWQVIEARASVSNETKMLRQAAAKGEYVSDGTARGDWLGTVGASLLGSAISAVPRSVETLHIGKQTHPHLADHAIDGAVVVPAVYPAEWLARAAQLERPDLFIAEILDVKVLKGIELPEFSAGAVASFSITSEIVSESPNDVTLALRLSDALTGRAHYSCRIAMREDRLPAPIFDPVSAETHRANEAPIYGSVLFHDASFQVLESVSEMAAAGCTASVLGVIAKRWAPEPWVTDPALLDGGLQLALLWNEFAVGRASLPTSIGLIRVYSGPPTGSLTATLTVREWSSARSLCDVSYSNADGQILAQLMGVETHMIGPKATDAQMSK